MDFDLVVTAQQVRSYKPTPPTSSSARGAWAPEGLGPRRSLPHHSDVSPCVKQRIPVIWVNRNKQALKSSQRKPTAEVPNLREAAKLLAGAP